MTQPVTLHGNDRDALTRTEERLGKQQAVRLFTSGTLDALPVGTFASLARIHAALFSQLCDFAGKIRDINLSKGGFIFAFAAFLPTTLRTVEVLPHQTFTDIVTKYSEMNAAHPFRDGNGRSTRLWLDCLLKKQCGVMVNWQCISLSAYMNAMRCSNRCDTVPLHDLLHGALTDRVTDLTIFMKNLDASFAYEGLHAFRTKDVLE